MNKKHKSDYKPVAFITGSSRGIGLAIAEKLSDAGFSLVLNGKTDSTALQKVTEIFMAKGTDVMSLPFDISDITLHQQMLDRIIDRFGYLDCLVNNAGTSVQSRGDLLNISEASFDEQIYVNLKAPFFLSQCLARWMRDNPSPFLRTIINISSSNAEAAAMERGEYSIAKSGVSMMTRLFSLRLADQGINVYEVKPGLIATDMTKVAKKVYDKRIKEGFSPINRWGHPDDVAKVVATLASGEWPFVTGESIHVDGGLLIPSY